MPHTEQDIRPIHHAPLEVLDIIVYDVDDDKTLLSCTLVCRLWSAAARRRRFRVVEISSGGRHHKFVDHKDPRRVVLSSLSAIPLLCDPTSTVLPLVQEIQLADSPYCRSLVDILPTLRVADLTMLQSVAITDIQWHKLSEQNWCSIAQLCRHQWITSLSLNVENLYNGISSAELIQLLLATKSIQSLRVTSDVRIERGPCNPSPGYDLVLVREISLITSIRIGQTLHAYLPALLATFSFPHLTDVILEEIALADLDDVMSFLRACSSTVERLRLKFGGLGGGWLVGDTRQLDKWRDIEQCFISRGGLYHLPALRTVNLTADLRYLPTILQPLMHAKHLEELTIKASPGMLSDCDQYTLAYSIWALAHVAVRLRVTFLCFWDNDYNPNSLYLSEDVFMRGDLLDSMRQIPVAKLWGLNGLDSGRLRFLRINRDFITMDAISIVEF